MMLDQKPYGPTPAPWKRPQGPEHGLALYKDFTPAELEILTPYVLSAEYQKMRTTETQYWLISKISEKLLERIETRAYFLLQATWEAGGEQYPRYAKAALAAYSEVFKIKEINSEKHLTAGILIAELHRRLGEFDEAGQMLQNLQNEEAGAMLKNIIAQEVALVNEKNSRPARIAR